MLNLPCKCTVINDVNLIKCNPIRLDMTAHVKPALKCTVINDVNLIKCNPIRLDMTTHVKPAL